MKVSDGLSFCWCTENDAEYFLLTWAGMRGG